MSLDTEVLIIGAGPAGLVLALSLLQNVVKVRVVEKANEMFIGQRGAGIVPRSIELFRILGVLPDIEQLATSVPRVKHYELKDNEVISTVSDMCPHADPTPSLPYLNPIILGQGRVQRILSKHLSDYGCEIEYGTELKSFEQFEDHVVANLVKSADNTKSEINLTANYVVGADGTRGTVRKLLGLSFLGETRTEEHWVIADVQLNNIDIDKEFWHTWGNFENGMAIIRPTSEGGYWVAIAGHNIDWPTLSTNEEAFTKLTREMTRIDGLQVEKFLTLGYYRVNIRMVDQFGKGRVFVAGDAAHAHSFIGAQGMNSSVQDSFNLGWKLALVIKDLSPPSILDSYNAERLPAIADVLKRTTQLLNKIVQVETATPMARDRSIYQLDLNYRYSAIVLEDLPSSTETRVRAGDRAPDAPGLIPLTLTGVFRVFDLFKYTHHTAIIFSQDADEVTAYVSALRTFPAGTMHPVVILPKDSNLAHEETISGWGVDVIMDGDEYCWSTFPTADGAKVVIVRPDGCVGALTQSTEGVERYKCLIFNQ